LVFLPGFILAWNAYSLLAVLLFLFSKATIPALGPMGCPVQWVLGAFSSGIKWRVQEAGSAPPYGVRVKNVQTVLPLATCLHAVCHGA